MNNSKFALITGASGGIGFEFSKLLAKKGYNLIITSRSLTKLELVKQKLLAENENADILCCACNLALEKERLELFSFVEENGVKVDLLVNVAGVDTQMSFSKYTQEKLVFQTRVIFEGTLDVTRFCLKNNSENLKVLTISSLCAIMPMPFFAVYSSLKNALVQVFKSIAYEYKNNKNIVFTTVLPGSVPTRADIVEDIKKQGLSGKLSQKSPQFVAEKSLNALKKRKKVYVPGFYNKIVNLFNKLTPDFIKMKIIARKFSHKEKDAFKENI